MPSKIQFSLVVLSLLFNNLIVYAPPRPDEKATLTLGAVRVNPKDGLKYVWIPPGRFQMGCSPGDNDCSKEESPSHQVTITKGFWLGQTEVTVGAYKRFAESSGREMPDAPDFNDRWAKEHMPIVDVSWDDAHDYCGWAEGRLPSEAEWEYAARGETTEPRYGSLDEIAWYSANSGGMTHDVAQKRANAFGLYDMLGNVWQWVNDPYDPNYYQNSLSQDPPGPLSGRLRVLRAGSWDFSGQFIRVSNRMGDTHSDWDFNFGIRCAMDVLNR